MTDQNTRDARADAKAERARQKALRPWYKKKRFVLPLAFVILSVIASVAGGGDGESQSTVRASNVSTSVPEATAKRFAGRPDAKRRDIERDIGESAELSGYTATLNAAALQRQLNSFLDAGYLVAEVTLLNRDEAAQSYNTFEWKLITPTGQIIDPFFGGDNLGHGDLAQGGTVSGKLTWEVGDQRGDFYIVYDPSDFGDERAVWKASIP